MAPSIMFLSFLTLLVIPFAQSARYMVYPIDRKDPRLCSELDERLKGLPSASSKIVLRVGFQKFITDFWLIEATTEVIAYVQRWKEQPQPLVSDEAR